MSVRRRRGRAVVGTTVRSGLTARRPDPFCTAVADQQPPPAWTSRTSVSITATSSGSIVRIQFLTDSTHHLAGQTVDLPEWPYGD